MIGLIFAVSCSGSRDGVGWRARLVDSEFRLNAQYSSCLNWPGSMRGPCSRTTTRKPFEDSSLASTPPADPEPTIRKSTASVVLNLAVVDIIGSASSRTRIPHRSSQKDALTCLDSRRLFISNQPATHLLVL